MALEPKQPPGYYVLLIFPGTKRPKSEPKSSLVSSAQVILLSTNFPLVLHFQLNEQKKFKSMRVCGTDITVKSELVAVQIHTPLLAKLVSFGFSVNCLQLQVLECLNCEVGGSKVQRN